MRNSVDKIVSHNLDAVQLTRSFIYGLLKLTDNRKVLVARQIDIEITAGKPIHRLDNIVNRLCVMGANYAREYRADNVAHNDDDCKNPKRRQCAVFDNIKKHK